MTESQKMSQIFRELSNTTLTFDVEAIKLNYTDQDLLNATLIFKHVLWNKSYDYFQKRNMQIDEMAKEAKFIGDELRALIQFATGLDLHKIADETSNGHLNN